MVSKTMEILSKLIIGKKMNIYQAIGDTMYIQGNLS